MLIRSVGLFWSVDNIYWGKGSNEGKLLGVPAGKSVKTTRHIDFRRQIGIYALYADYQMIYVGQAVNQQTYLFERLKQHRKDDLAGRWNRFSWFGLRWVKTDGELSAQTLKAHAEIGDVLNHIEAILIHASEPALNRQGGRFGDKVVRYTQVRDPRLGPTDRELLVEIRKHLPDR